MEQQHFEETLPVGKGLLDKNIGGPIYAKMVTGKIHCGFPLSQQRRQRQFIGDKLRGNLGSGEGRIKAKVVTGNFNLEEKKAVAA